MKATVFHKIKDVRVENVDDPVIEDPRDAIIEVTATAICGSDLHIYNAQIPQLKNMVLGHEFMGIVVETGSEVRNLKKGDRVVVPFPISCGECFFCQHGEYPHCENSNPKYGPEGDILSEKGAALFGYTDLYGGYSGGQAEYVRVPYADVGPRVVSRDFTDEEVLFMTDIFPTGYAAIDRAQVKGGETIAVFGCGPVGLMAQKAAWLRGAGRVIGVDVEQYRLDMAQKAGRADTLLADEDVVDKIREMTNGRGADVVVDAVGLEADRSIVDRLKSAVHVQSGTINALKMCLSAVRRAGTVSIVGVYGTNYSDFPLGKIFDKALTITSGQAPVQLYIDQLLEHLKHREIVLDDIITHKLPLSEAPYGYDIFNKKEDNCVKVVLYPGTTRAA